MASRQENIKHRRELMEELRKREAGDKMEPKEEMQEESSVEASEKKKSKKRVVKKED